MLKKRLKQLRSLHRLSSRWLPWKRKTRSERILLLTRELMFERLFTNALPGLGIKSRYYPVKNAANYSLLYLVLRIVTELPVRRVLEFGCGQTTLLLDDLAKHTPINVASVEHNSEWCERMQTQVNHQIHYAPLVEREVQGQLCETYSVLPAELGSIMDLIIVDGPVGKKNRSRWGALEYIESMLQPDFVIIFDDVSRVGEQETIEEAIRLLERQGRSYALTVTRSVKSQCVIAGGVFEGARYF